MPAKPKDKWHAARESARSGPGRPELWDSSKFHLTMPEFRKRFAEKLAFYQAEKKARRKRKEPPNPKPPRQLATEELMKECGATDTEWVTFYNFLSKHRALSPRSGASRGKPIE